MRAGQRAAAAARRAAGARRARSAAAAADVGAVMRRLRGMYESPIAHSQYDPAVTQLEHALQSARLAEMETQGCKTSVAAAFLHDIGHLVLDEHSGNDDFLTEDLCHERVGAQGLADMGFPPSVVGAVDLHVSAKRYLCATEPGYWDALSSASKRSLEVQGGTFADDDAAAFIVRPGAELAVRVRRWDDRAKTSGVETKPAAAYLDYVEVVLQEHAAAESEAAVLPAATIQQYRNDGYVALKGMLSREDIASLRYWANEVEALDAGVALQHYELCGDGSRRTTRTEDFIPHHPQLRRLITTGRIPAALGQLLGEAVTLYKEKLNYKYPHSGTYAAHQDAPAYPETKHHLTALIAVDDATEEAGCLEFAKGHASYRAQEFLALNADGVIDRAVADALEWTPCPVEAGDITVFDSYSPHRSGVNTTANPRRVLYLTFNASSEGDLRAAYYKNKRQQLAEGRISLIKHWQGTPAK